MRDEPAERPDAAPPTGHPGSTTEPFEPAPWIERPQPSGSAAPPGATPSTGGPGPPGPDPGRIAVLEGWGHGALRALAAFLVVLGLGMAVAVLDAAGSPSEQLSAGEVPRAGALVFGLFHRVPVEVGLLSAPPATAVRGFSVTLILSLCLMGGLGLAGWLLWRAGRAVAERAGGPSWARAAHGLKVAVPYAALSLALSFLARVSATAGAVTSGRADIGLSPLGAFLWPLAIGTACAVAGALATAEQPFPGTWGRRLGAAVAGGWRMAIGAVLLGTIGFLVFAGVHPQETRAYFEFAGRQGFAGGTLVVLSTVLFLPNVGAGVAAAAMGGSWNLSALGRSCALVSYTQFPAGTTAPATGAASLIDPCARLPVAFEAAAPVYLLYLLVPLVATITAGAWTARRAGATTRAEGATMGAGAGPVFMLWFLALLFLAGVSYRAEGGFFELAGVGASTGPGLVSGALLALVWGTAGGAVGGAIGVRAPHAPEHAETGFEEP